jgi:threonylcarbamoyladenosine tRNA methylthiotransferase MtaB
MATFQIINFGCRATQADAAAIEADLLRNGCMPARENHGAEVVVVNTCTVTAAADLQARQTIASIAKQSPSAKILVTGCYAQRAPEELAEIAGVNWVVGNSHRTQIAQLVCNSSESRAEFSAIVPLEKLMGATQPTRANVLVADIFEEKFRYWDISASDAQFRGLGHTRPTLKIQDGCNNRCAYCVIPSVRGRSRSMAPGAIVGAIDGAVREGAQEIVLSGINLGSYGRDLSPRVEFVELLRRIIKNTELARVRISSIEPMDVTEELIEVIAATDRIARHFHMPLQSGSDKILAAMHRWYRAAHYAEHVELIRKILPDAAIGADVIAGFPGETEEDHRTTMEFIDRLPLSYLHVFSFSPRPGTSAENLGEQVAQKEIHERARELRALGEKKKSAFRAAQIGKQMRALTLETRKKSAATTRTRAISSNYLDLLVEGSWPANEWVNVEALTVDNGRMIARPVSSSSFENHLRQRSIRAVGDAQRNVGDAEPRGEFLRAPV